MAELEGSVLRTSPSRTSHKTTYRLTCPTHPSEPPSPPPNSPLPALPTCLPQNAAIQRQANLGPPPRPPRPQTSLPNLTPRLIKSPDRPSRPFNPFVVEQIRNSPAQISCPSLCPIRESIDDCVTSTTKKPDVESTRYESSRPSESDAFRDDLSRTFGRSEVIDEVSSISGSLKAQNAQLEGLTERSCHKQSTRVDPTSRALVRSPLHIPATRSPLSSSFPTRSIESMRSEESRSNSCISDFNQSSRARVLGNSPVLTLKVSDEVSRHSSIDKTALAGTITSLPRVFDHSPDLISRYEDDFFSIAYSNTNDSPRRLPVTICSVERGENDHLENNENSSKERFCRNETQVQGEIPPVSCLSGTCIYSHSAYSSSSQSRSLTFGDITRSNSAGESWEVMRRLSWCARHRSQLWMLATVLLVLLATVGITGGIVAKLRTLGMNEDAE